MWCFAQKNLGRERVEFVREIRGDFLPAVANRARERRNHCVRISNRERRGSQSESRQSQYTGEENSKMPGNLEKKTEIIFPLLEYCT